VPKHKQACLKSVFHFKHAGPLSGKKIILPGELILNKKKPAAFCFRRSATPTLPGFASLRFAKPAAMLRRVRGMPDGADCKRGKNACYQKYAFS